MSRRLSSIGLWTLLLAFVAAIGAAAFAILGPPRGWGTDVEDASPNFSGEASSALLDAVRSGAADTAPSYPHRELRTPDGVSGKPLYLDQHTESGEAVLMTTGATWTKDQRLYWRSDSGGRWSEIGVPGGFIISHPKLIRSGGRAALLIERWYPWWPYTHSYARFVRSVARPELRAEYGIYLFDVESATPRFLFPGENLVLSPDRRFAAYVSSEHHGFAGGGFHTVHVWELETGRRGAVVSLWEIDPGSGRSFRYAWTRDSRALLIAGSTSGFGRSAAPPRGPVRLLFTLDPRSLHLLD